MARDQLRVRRDQLSLTQEDLAAMIGVDPMTVRRWETTESMPRPWARRALAEMLKVDIDELMRMLQIEPAVTGQDGTGLESCLCGGGESMRRRSLLSAVPALATALLPSSVSALEVELSTLWTSYQASRYQSVVERLPGLLAQLQSHSSHAGDRRQCERLLGFAYQLSSTVLTKLGHQEPALNALDEGIRAAERSENPLVLASIKRSQAHTLLTFGYASNALGLAESAIVSSAALSRDDSPDALSVEGTVCLVAAVAAAKEGDAKLTGRFLDRAEGIAQRLGRDANCLWTAFGPTNVAIHRVVTSVELGQPRKAIASAPIASLQSLPSERRARHAIELARAHSLVGQVDEGVAVLTEAEADASEQIRNHRVSRQLVESWLSSHGHNHKVVSLAQRMHLESA
ncbi:helix-turn-helix transcriptional regulator [Natronoglycomyces albus]|uniref:Helix-turn-helix transcriptional regulator n=1 Tax=Natronoglycomyces albus TaxID=2811108 RepID=A0A895XXU8_9ACTN|nr:helix-turn-helix transcriptional regulator [Natronoglycomyces albus]QSB06448.1 helix-turn-helix transcriptional regulator [Natronoglycomyces albus]